MTSSPIVRATRSTGRRTARTVRAHPRAAAEGGGLLVLAGAGVALLLVWRVLRSDRARRAASRSARRGAFGPAVAAGVRVRDRLGDDAS